MMKHLKICLILLVVGRVASGQDSTGAISSTDVREAISNGTGGKPPFGLALGTAGSGFAASMARNLNAGYAVYIQGPLGRISTAAYQSHKRYQAFTADSVTPWMQSPLVAVFVEPAPPTRLPSGRMEENPGVDHVVLMADDNPIQPVKTEPVPVEWQNLMGATFTGRGIVAYFDRTKIPNSDFKVVIIPTKGDEVRYGVKAKDLRLVR